MLLLLLLPCIQLADLATRTSAGDVEGLPQSGDCRAGDEPCAPVKGMWPTRAPSFLSSESDGDAEHADVLALLFSLLGGFFMGAYPVPIKAPGVLKANPHPVIFQCYKTFWVFVTGWLFLLPRWWQGKVPVFCFTWWGTVSALGWIPGGVCAIAAVPRLGVGMTVAVSTSAASILTFVVFWLVLGESMKEHIIAGQRIYFAPVYLGCIVVGMAGLVMAMGLATTRQPSSVGTEGRNTQAMVGMFLALAVGLFSALQFGAVNLGKRVARRSAGCAQDGANCSPQFEEAFNNFGSWMASFGVGAALVTGLFLAGVTSHAALRRQPLPSFHWKALGVPGTAAGLLWSLGNFFQTAAVVRGGNAVMLPANQAIQLVTSGAFGLLYYHEVPDRRRALLWTAAALWTLGFILLLSQEKA